MLKEAGKILGFLTDRRWCCMVDCELALQLQHMCHYQIRAQSCRTLSNFQGSSAPCNLSQSSLEGQKQHKAAKVSLTQCSTLQFTSLLCRHFHCKGKGPWAGVFVSLEWNSSENQMYEVSGRKKIPNKTSNVTG